MAGGEQERSAEDGASTKEGSQACGEEGDVAGPWACSCPHIHTRVPDREAAGRWSLWGADWEREEKTSCSWQCIT